ncbi:MAG: pyridoxamine 5'-phosphate oxidase family protein [Actinomycetota bacterium]|nr:pyridoxamine 5'-phosphate oxidase family protein [Actinomycetota bacterium]
MGRIYDAITEPLARFVAEQPMFFVATAPLADHGRVNLSPKGMDTLRVVDARTIAYVDFVGSGAETIAHLRDNGRITIMWCSFGSTPRILRAYGRGTHLLPDDPEFATLAAIFPDYHAVRSIIRIQVDRLADSCGYGVPQMDLTRQRSRMTEWGRNKTAEELVTYQQEKNAISIDGLPAVDTQPVTRRRASPQE